MIIEHGNLFNIKKIEKQFRDAGLERPLAGIKAASQQYLLRHSALNEIGTKLENLDSEYSVNFDHNPIHHMEERMKEPTSLLEKVNRKGLELTVENMFDQMYDVAGIRVITNYIGDIYRVKDALAQQSDVSIIKEKDYLAEPKPNGYRSYHLIVSVPVFQDQGVHDVPVEIQFRTIGMDMWASLEHELRYKSLADSEKTDQYANKLKDYSDQLFEIELNMQEIFEGLQAEES